MKELRFIDWNTSDDIETRAEIDSETKQRVIAGHGAVFNRKSVVMSEFIREGLTGNYELRTFTETITPNAFDTAGKSGVIDHLIPGQTDHPKLSPKSESFAGHF